MSREFEIRPGRRTLGRRAVTLGGVGIALLVIGGAGSLVGAQSASVASEAQPAVGRTTSVCTVADASGSRTDVQAVSVGDSKSRPGRLTAESVAGQQASLDIQDAGHGTTLQRRNSSMLLQAEGGMAAGSAGAVIGTATSGDQAGLMAAPCVMPSTMHWFVGVGTGKNDETELILTNPDQAQAEVDLRFYGRRGRVAVPGSPGITVPGRSSRAITLSSLVSGDSQRPLSVAVRASVGRVAVVAKALRSTKLNPSGADYQLGSVAPVTSVVIPAVPDGDGDRRLVVTNPGAVRASVSIQVLGLQGAYAPAGADSLELAPESSAEVDLAEGLAGEYGAIRLSSDQPVTGAVLSSSQRGSAQSDIAIQSAVAPLVGAGVSAIATTDIAGSNLVVSNGTDTDTRVSFEVLSYDGASLRSDDIFLSAYSTATRRLNSPAPSYVVVRVPAGSGVFGGVVLTQPEGGIAGLSTIPLLSPDIAGHAPDAIPDPRVGR